MSERMIERDEATQNWLKDSQVNSIRSRIPPKGQLGPEDCQECGNDIPMKRREHGYELCVACAERRERNVGR
ncbi:TraR/DksA C4-type zinc finger protein [Marinobacter nauticus]|uniref:DksA C4-type domain-containing protein n=1 Tax=Marinobacter nauticus TaxID=2743 RepID=A0A833N9U5_MARNT|nr:hypothetical protein [Marinobacter nauticus]KAE8546172.1 hypothetical protein F6453_1418 [Marinobacter nauticus]